MAPSHTAIDDVHPDLSTKHVGLDAALMHRFSCVAEQNTEEGNPSIFFETGRAIIETPSRVTYELHATVMSRAYIYI